MCRKAFIFHFSNQKKTTDIYGHHNGENQKKRNKNIRKPKQKWRIFLELWQAKQNIQNRSHQVMVGGLPPIYVNFFIKSHTMNAEDTAHQDDDDDRDDL